MSCLPWRNSPSENNSRYRRHETEGSGWTMKNNIPFFSQGLILITTGFMKLGFVPEQAFIVTLGWNWEMNWELHSTVLWEENVCVCFKLSNLLEIISSCKCVCSVMASHWLKTIPTIVHWFEKTCGDYKNPCRIKHCLTAHAEMCCGCGGLAGSLCWCRCGTKGHLTLIIFLPCGDSDMRLHPEAVPPWLPLIPLHNQGRVSLV